MVKVTNQALAALAVITTFGVIYSLIFDTALDTSNPLLAHIPQPNRTSYFAQKSNIFNVLFVKNAWGWTSIAFLTLYATSPPEKAKLRRLGRWVVTTFVWAVFASWFFGPALFDRIITASGGQCLIRLPQAVSTGTGIAADSRSPYVAIPVEYCEAKLKLSPRTHPTLFTDPRIVDAFAASQGKSLSELDISFRPKLYYGHDVSGHLFLLTLSILFLVDQVGYSLPPPFTSLDASSAPASKPSALHVATVYGTLALISLWYWMAFTTCVYFHTVPEKVSGFVIGVAGFLFTTLVVP
ncbi:Fat storage-inducing transmembrane protein [Cantharellus anzutake]|uniref:Fat storage-inducing transmembrane protein n=1 Tax=Cantharellus anzutake TaxID=1750568 RepID=UPI00190699D1|nr:Fat storage-inducing transmembrane protein [Cantharellus anzutake]KAF8332643.1 Fat storage-inducing transmembrane protein [Cantharellus anzutake]